MEQINSRYDRYYCIYLDSNKGLIDPYLQVQDIKERIKEMSGISQDNVRFKVFFDSDTSCSDTSNFWSHLRIRFYDASRYYVKLKRNFFEEELYLNLNKTIEDLKKSINKDTNIPIERLQFQLDNMILDNKEILGHYNLLEKKLSVNITRELKDQIRIKTPDSIELQIYTDLCNTGIEFLKDIQGNSINSCSDIKYNLVYNNKNLDLGNLLVSSGIKNGDLIELKPRNNTFEVTIRTLTGKNIPLFLDSLDTVHNMQILVYLLEKIPPDQQRLIFEGKQLEPNKTLADCNIKKESVVHLVLRLRGGKI